MESAPAAVAVAGGPQSDPQRRGLLPAFLLLLLHEAPGHGYDLIDRLRPFGLHRSARAVYRALEKLEADDLVRSGWDLPRSGPARRVYELTPAGEQALEAWSDRLRGLRELAGEHLDRFEAAEREPAQEEQGAARHGRRRFRGRFRASRAH